MGHSLSTLVACSTVGTKVRKVVLGRTNRGGLVLAVQSSERYAVPGLGRTAVTNGFTVVVGITHTGTAVETMLVTARHTLDFTSNQKKETNKRTRRTHVVVVVRSRIGCGQCDQRCMTSFFFLSCFLPGSKIARGAFAVHANGMVAAPETLVAQVGVGQIFQTQAAQSTIGTTHGTNGNTSCPVFAMRSFVAGWTKTRRGYSGGVFAHSSVDAKAVLMTIASSKCKFFTILSD